MSASNVFPATEGPDRPSVPLPRPTAIGLAFFLAAATVMTFGALRGEVTAILWSSIMLAAEAYAFVALLLALAVRRSDIHRYSCLMDPRECKQGDRIVASAHGHTRFRPPLILVRYAVTLATADERRTIISLDPERSGHIEFYAGGRGAYAAAEDKLCIIDAFGFFRSAYSIPAEQGARLVVRPAPAADTPLAPKLSGGAELRTERTFRRTEDLTDNRRYAPGDDPRRINWKIFGHAGELFVREGEPEPPPRSRFVVLIDASVDPDLFDPDSGRLAVDALAELALGLVNSVVAAGFEPRFGYNGGVILSGDARDAAAAFAVPAAIPLEKAAALPNLGQNDGGAIVMALPRRVGVPSVLERFIHDPTHVANTNIIFVVPKIEKSKRLSRMERFMIHPREEVTESRQYGGRFDPYAIERAADECIAAYGGRGGIHARRTEA